VDAAANCPAIAADVPYLSAPDSLDDEAATAGTAASTPPATNSAATTPTAAERHNATFTRRTYRSFYPLINDEFTPRIGR
jgi:hypothetical protein